MPPVPTPEMTDDSSSNNNQMPGKPSLLIDDDDKLDASPAAVDLEKGLGGTTHTTRGGMYLRWARITKEVEIKEGSGWVIAKQFLFVSFHCCIYLHMLLLSCLGGAEWSRVTINF